jgi:hypothetical protein
MKIRWPDPLVIAAGERMRKSVLTVLALVVMACVAGYAMVAFSELSAARQSLEAAKSAASLLPMESVVRKVSVGDPKRKAYLAEMDATAIRLAVDWSARLGEVERVLGEEARLNSFRLDAQKGEIEIKGEVESGARLSSLVRRFTQAKLDANLSRVSSLAVGFEYVMLISWPK